MPRTPPSSSSARRGPTGKGVVRAIYAVTGVVDEVNDLIVPGTFTRTLATRRVKAAWHHDWKEPVGTVLDVEEWKPGDPRFATIPGGTMWPAAAGALVATVQYNLRTRRGRDAYEQVRQWHENNEAQFSIGYKVVAGGASKRHDGVRVIHDLELYEISPVLHGAHPMTRSLEVKAAHRPGGDELERKATWSAIELKAAEAQAGRGTMVALLLPPDVAAQIAHPEGTSADHLHVTLAYLGDAADLGAEPEQLHSVVSSAASGAAPLKGSIGGIGRFPDSGDGEPTWVPVDVPGLAELRQRIVGALGSSVFSEKLNTQHGYTPHVTLGYAMPDIKPVPATPVTFDQVTIVHGPDIFIVPLGQPAPAPVTSPVPAPAAGPAAPGPIESKSAAQIVTEAKGAVLGAHHGDHERKSAAQIVLEAKSVPLPKAEPMTPMTPMPLSYEQLHARIAEAARGLLTDGAGECWVAVEATYPDHVIVTRHSPADSATYSIPYSAAGRDIDLGTPSEVELTTVALPVTGEGHAVGGDEEITARYMEPSAVALQDATALIEVSEAGPEHLQHLKPTIAELLRTLSKKGLPMDKQTAPSGSSLNLWDDEFEITDGWGDEDETPTDPSAPALADDTGVTPAPAEGTEIVRADGSAPGPKNPTSGPVADAEEDDEEETVRLDPSEVKALLASLTL
ncbi:2'-5' RNA ligase family protein [Streptomyces microflavus]|uniref:2'-5' RNA ligase family protein n=1 Tax=Streptomyces microflavus TaxID=1919 RepID=UPI003402704B